MSAMRSSSHQPRFVGLSNPPMPPLLSNYRLPAAQPPQQQSQPQPSRGTYQNQSRAQYGTRSANRRSNANYHQQQQSYEHRGELRHYPSGIPNGQPFARQPNRHAAQKQNAPFESAWIRPVKMRPRDAETARNSDRKTPAISPVDTCTDFVDSASSALCEQSVDSVCGTPPVASSPTPADASPKDSVSTVVESLDKLDINAENATADDYQTEPETNSNASFVSTQDFEKDDTTVEADAKADLPTVTNDDPEPTKTEDESAEKQHSETVPAVSQPVVAIQAQVSSDGRQSRSSKHQESGQSAVTSSISPYPRQRSQNYSNQIECRPSLAPIPPVQNYQPYLFQGLQGSSSSTGPTSYVLPNHYGQSVQMAPQPVPYQWKFHGSNIYGNSWSPSGPPHQTTPVVITSANENAINYAPGRTWHHFHPTASNANIDTMLAQSNRCIQTMALGPASQTAQVGVPMYAQAPLANAPMGQQVISVVRSFVDPPSNQTVAVGNVSLYQINQANQQMRLPNAGEYSVYPVADSQATALHYNSEQSTALESSAELHHHPQRPSRYESHLASGQMQQPMQAPACQTVYTPNFLTCYNHYYPANATYSAPAYAYNNGLIQQATHQAQQLQQQLMNHKRQLVSMYTVPINEPPAPVAPMTGAVRSFPPLIFTYPAPMVPSADGSAHVIGGYATGSQQN